MDAQSPQTLIVKRVGLAAIILMQLLGGSIFVGLYQLLLEVGQHEGMLSSFLSYAWGAWLVNFIAVLAWLLIRRRWHDKRLFWWSFSIALASVMLMVLVMTSIIQL